MPTGRAELKFEEDGGPTATTYFKDGVQFRGRTAPSCFIPDGPRFKDNPLNRAEMYKKTSGLLLSPFHEDKDAYFKNRTDVSYKHQIGHFASTRKDWDKTVSIADVEGQRGVDFIDTDQGSKMMLTTLVAHSPIKHAASFK